MDLLKRILDEAAAALSQRVGLSVLYDPQPVRTGEPSLRLTYMGSEDGGRGHMVLKWLVSLTGAGDGPDVYLPRVIGASLRLESLYDRCRSLGFIDLDVDGTKARMSFVAGLVATGSFSQNEMKVVETGQWSYLWTEPKYISISIPDSVWEKED